MKISLLDSNINVKKHCNISFRSSDQIKNDTSNQEDGYVKISKTQDRLNKVLWIIVGISALFGIGKAISDNKKIPKL